MVHVQLGSARHQFLINGFFCSESAVLQHQKTPSAFTSQLADPNVSAGDVRSGIRPMFGVVPSMSRGGGLQRRTCPC